MDRQHYELCRHLIKDQEMKKALLLITTIALMGVFMMGCASAREQQEKILDKMTPSMRADYRDGLQSLSDVFDALYDREGYPWPAEEPPVE